MQVVRIAVRCHAQRQRKAAIRCRCGGLVVMCGRRGGHAHAAGRLMRMAVEAVRLKVAVHGVHLCGRCVGVGLLRSVAGSFGWAVNARYSGRLMIYDDVQRKVERILVCMCSFDLKCAFFVCL